MTDLLLINQALAVLQPPPKLSLSEWADRHFRLSAESAAVAGQWSTLPYQREILDSFSDPTVDTVVWMKSARVGATKLFNITVAYHMAQDPTTILVVQPAVEDAEGYSKDEVAPMLRDVPALRGLVNDSRKEKTNSATVLLKSFPGGTLQMVGANSPRGFRRVSRRVVLFDEVDAYPASTAEGDQIKLGIKRSEYYWNRKIGLASTPTTKDFSRIERWFEQGDQRRYFVPCPECGAHQVLRWQQMKWQPDQPETAAYECENCAALIPHSQKRWMVERGEWRATATPSRPGLRSYHIWAGYGYSPNSTWEQLVREFLEVKGDRDQLRTFVNVVLGETFEEDYATKQTPEALMARREDYGSGVCPDGVLLLTAGVDVQGGGGSIGERLAVSVWGWGRGEEAWLVWHGEIHGDPTRAEVWEQLDSVLQTNWPRAGGGELRISQAAVDSGGHATHEVYGYCRERKAWGVVPIKGANVKGSPVLGKGKAVDVNQRGRILNRGVLLYMVGGDAIKTTLYGRLRHGVPGPGFLHFGQAADDEFFRQLTAEKVQVRNLRGFPVREWVKRPGDRNEALDCAVYAYAALQLTARRYNRAKMWDQLEAQVAQRQALPVAPAPAAEPPARRRQRPARGGASFVNGW
jgi:phage terminase large subunit GpA-like protein